MIKHWWTYKESKVWICIQCNKQCTDPTYGWAAQATCPGK